MPRSSSFLVESILSRDVTKKTAENAQVTSSFLPHSGSGLTASHSYGASQITRAPRLMDLTKLDAIDSSPFFINHQRFVATSFFRPVTSSTLHGDTTRSLLEFSPSFNDPRSQLSVRPPIVPHGSLQTQHSDGGCTTKEGW